MRLISCWCSCLTICALIIHLHITCTPSQLFIHGVRSCYPSLTFPFVDTQEAPSALLSRAYPSNGLVLISPINLLCALYLGGGQPLVSPTPTAQQCWLCVRLYLYLRSSLTSSCTWDFYLALSSFSLGSDASKGFDVKCSGRGWQLLGTSTEVALLAAVLGTSGAP